MEYLGEYMSGDFWQEAMRQIAGWALTTIPSLVLVSFLAIVSSRLLRFGVRRLGRLLAKRAEEKAPGEEIRKQIDTVTGILRKAGALTIWLVASMIMLRQLGVEIAPIVASAGIAGLAIGFGAQNMVRDVISGLFMLLENQVRVGDVAVVNGTGGLVEAISVRTIVLRDLEGVVHVFPHGQVQSLSNMTKDWSAALLDVGVAYKEDTDEVVRVMTKVFEEMQGEGEWSDRIIEQIEIFGVDRFGESEVVIKARIKTRPLQQWSVAREYRRRLKKAFDAHRIEIPFPHRTIYWGESGGKPGGPVPAGTLERVVR